MKSIEKRASQMLLGIMGVGTVVSTGEPQLDGSIVIRQTQHLLSKEVHTFKVHDSYSVVHF